MSTTTHSPRKVLAWALEIGKRTLRDHASRFAPRTFTQPQLFACLVLRMFYDLDYRRVAALLADCRDLRETIGLSRAPHFTTLQKAAHRLLTEARVRRLLDASVGNVFAPVLDVQRLAGDATGLESRRISPYFVRRRARGHNNAANPLYQTSRYTRFPKLVAACDADTHLILAAAATLGPGPDILHARRLLTDAARRAHVRTALLDAGFDAEWVHVLARDRLNVHAIIPARIGRPTSKPPSGLHRRAMHESFPRDEYGQRWQIETVFSMIKRRLGAHLRARSNAARNREIMLKVLTHNIMILL